MVTCQVKSLHLKLIIVKWLNSEIFCTLFLPDPNLAWGRGKMGEMGERGEEGWDLLGNSSHPWSGVYGACVGADRSGIPPIKI